MVGRALKLTLAGLVLLALAPGAALAGALVQEFNDSIYRTDGNSDNNVKILEDSWKGVKIKPRAGSAIPSVEFDVSSVSGVDYGNRVAEYGSAMEAKRSDLAKAAGLFLTGLAKTKDMNQHQYFLAGLVECYEGQNNPDEMRKYIRKMVAIKPAPRLIYDVYLKLGRSYLALRDYAAAETAYGEAEAFFAVLEKKAMRITKPGVRKKVTLYRLWAKYWKIYSLEKQGKTKIEGRTGAARGYNLFTSEATGHPRLVGMARIGMARCDSVIGKHDAAIKALEKIRDDLRAAAKKDPTTIQVLPAAYVALGDVSFNKLDYRRARWYYLKVIVRYSADRAALARAHFQAAQCYEKLGASPTREREAIRRALRHYRIVKSEFRDCLEHAQARERLNKLES